jgi:hypothetical protein
MPEAAPLPIFRFLYQAVPHRISMGVAQFFDELFMGMKIGIVVTLLPKLDTVCLGLLRNGDFQRLNRVESSFFSVSEIKRCTWLGITTYPWIRIP